MVQVFSWVAPKCLGQSLETLKEGQTCLLTHSCSHNVRAWGSGTHPNTLPGPLCVLGRFEGPCGQDILMCHVDKGCHRNPLSITIWREEP